MYFLKLIFYTPLYNALVFLIQHVPSADLGFAVIVLTILVRLIIAPLNLNVIKTQVKLRALEPELAALRKKYEGDKTKEAEALFAFYRENHVNPFGGILPLLIQTPILISLYFIFRSSGLPHIDGTLLYPFVHLPSMVNVQFLNIINIIQKSLVLAAFVAITQIIQVRFSIPAMPKVEGKSSFQNDLAKSMNLQMRYTLPLMTAYISYITSGAVALYFITSNLFSIAQEIYVRKTIRKKS